MPEVQKVEAAKLPWATLFAVAFSLISGIVALIDPGSLSFDQYTTQVAVVWGFLAVGRGFAQKEQDTVLLSPLNKFISTFPWATVVVGIVAIVGYIGVVIGDTAMTYEDLGIKLGILIGALGLGRGAGVLKKDLMTNGGAVAGQPHDPGYEITEEADIPSGEGKYGEGDRDPVIGEEKRPGV